MLIRLYSCRIVWWKELEYQYDPENFFTSHICAQYDTQFSTMYTAGNLNLRVVEAVLGIHKKKS